jgi:phage terminase large subunit
MLTLNPVGGHAAPIKRRYFDRVDLDAAVFVSTIDNNPLLDASYTQSLERLKDSNATLYQIYRYGLWATCTDDVIFNNVTILPRTNWPLDFEDKYYGLDFGFNNPSACCFVGIRDGNKFYLDEKLYQRGLTNKDLIARLKDLHVNKYTEIIADSAEPARIQEISDAGFFCTAQDKSAHSVRAGINLMQAGQLLVRETSVNLIKELQEYRWKTGKDGILLDEPVKYADHLIDAVRGVVFRTFKDSGESAAVSVANWDYQPCAV